MKKFIAAILLALSFFTPDARAEDKMCFRNYDGVETPVDKPRAGHTNQVSCCHTFAMWGVDGFEYYLEDERSSNGSPAREFGPPPASAGPLVQAWHAYLNDPAHPYNRCVELPPGRDMNGHMPPANKPDGWCSKPFGDVPFTANRHPQVYVAYKCGTQPPPRPTQPRGSTPTPRVTSRPTPRPTPSGCCDPNKMPCPKGVPICGSTSPTPAVTPCPPPGQYGCFTCAPGLPRICVDPPAKPIPNASSSPCPH